MPALMLRSGGRLVRALSSKSAVALLPATSLQQLHKRLDPLFAELHSRFAHLQNASSLRPSQALELRSLTPLASLLSESQHLSRQLEEALSLQQESDTDLRILAQEEEQTLRSLLSQNALSQLDLLLRLQDSSQDCSSPQATSVIVEIRAGTGGDEAALFVTDLYNMYTCYFQKRRWNSSELSRSETSRGGLRQVILRVRGDNVSDLNTEAGVHRVQRVPATETQGRIHTSTAAVAVLADVKAEEVEIDEAEIRVDVYRASGAGGQHVNTTESAVRVTHVPSGIVATCQEERSQKRNKMKAMEILRVRVGVMRREEERKRRVEERRGQLGCVLGERSDRIRTYNFPQKRVTDHRIVVGEELKSLGVNVGDKNMRLNAVLDGELTDLIHGVQKARQLDQLITLLHKANTL